MKIKSILACTILSLCSQVQAQDTFHSSRPLLPQPSECITLRILNPSGVPFQEFLGQRQHWIEGTNGAEYVIQLSNSCSERLLALVSVDGLNVLNGQKAAFDQSGYVLAPYGKAQIRGWRKSMNESARFYFTYPSDSYASRTHRPDNLGVIGAAFFWEIPPPIHYEAAPSTSRFDSQTMGSSQSAARAESGKGFNALPATAAAAPSLGTGHGSVQYDSVTSTEFKRQRMPFHTQSVRYETHEGLLAQGIIRESDEPRTPPNAFPGNRSFVPDPPR